jgi:molybdate transport system substrate-binding protein
MTRLVTRLGALALVLTLALALVSACAPAAAPATSPTAAAAKAAATAPAATTAAAATAKPAATPQPPLSGRLTILAAASLTEAFNEIIEQLKRDHPQLQVDVSYASSSALRTQIENGVGFDVFASADGLQMAPVERAGLVQPSVPFVRNRLAVIVPKANPGRVLSFADLGRPGLKFVTTAQTVPVGNYTREALAKAAASGDAAFGSDFAQRVLRNVVSEEDNVRQVLNKVQLGEADAGVVYTSDVTPRASQDVTLVPIADAYNTIALYPIAVAARPQNAVAAQRFVEMVLGPAGRAALQKNNFIPLE